MAEEFPRRRVDLKKVQAALAARLERKAKEHNEVKPARDQASLSRGYKR